MKIRTTKVRKFFIGCLVLLSISGCGLSRSDIEDNVAAELQNTLDNDANFKKHDLIVEYVRVFKKEGNSYKGIATVTFRGAKYQVPMDIVVDRREIIWEVDSREFHFVTRAELEEIERKFQEQTQGTLENFQKNMEGLLRDLNR